MSTLPLLPALLALWSPGDTALEQATEAFQRGAYATVLELARAHSADGTDGPRLSYLAGEAQLVLGAPSEAEQAFRSVLERRPDAIPAQVGLGRALTALGRNEEAAGILGATLRAAPEDVGALCAHGLLLSATGHSPEAREELSRAAKLDPRGALTIRSLVEVLLRADDVPAAAAAIEAFVQECPEHPMGPFLMAWTMERDGEDEGAIEQYREALARDPSFIDAHKNLAILCHTLSDTYQDKVRVEMAFEHYGRYFELGGKDPELRGMYDQLLGFRDQILAR